MKDEIMNLVSAVSKLPISQLEETFQKKVIWDSLTNVEIIMTLEEEFNIRFCEQEIGDITTLSQLVSTVKNKLYEEN